MTFLSLFSGIGALDLGLKQAGHRCVGWCEIDKHAQASYRAIHDDADKLWFAPDIRAVDPRSMPKADMWAFGFPCQPFSLNGKRRGFDDEKGDLINVALKLLEDQEEQNKPRYLFIENVRGITSLDSGRSLFRLLMAIRELGYIVGFGYANSAGFVPQDRLRIFIVGYAGTARFNPEQIFSQFCREEESDELQLLSQTVAATYGRRVGRGSHIGYTAALAPTLTASGGQNRSVGAYICERSQGRQKEESSEGSL